MSKQWIFVGLIVRRRRRRRHHHDQGRQRGRAGGGRGDARRISGRSISPPAIRCPCASATAGKVTLVNIWATWCVPCRVEMPSMEQLYTPLAPRGFAIAAVSIDEGRPEDVRAFGRELGLSFDLLQDRSTGVQQLYQTTGVPESFLLDRHGVIVKRVIGAHDWNSPANRALVERLLDEPGHVT